MTIVDVSVVMSVHNACFESLNKSINSILEQSYKNFELIIVDDINTREISKFLQKLALNNKKVNLITNRSNLGLTKSLIKGIKIAQGKYIARQDADDYSNFKRLEKQVSFLKNKDTVLLGSNYKVEFNENILKSYELPYENNEIINRFLYSNPICHTSAMFLKSAYIKSGGYNCNFIYAQDFELWPRLGKLGKIANLSDFLVVRSVNKKNISMKAYVTLYQIYVGLYVRLRERKSFENRLFYLIVLTIAIRHLILLV